MNPIDCIKKVLPSALWHFSARSQFNLKNKKMLNNIFFVCVFFFFFVCFFFWGGGGWGEEGRERGMFTSQVQRCSCLMIMYGKILIIQA